MVMCKQILAFFSIKECVRLACILKRDVTLFFACINVIHKDVTFETSHYYSFPNFLSQFENYCPRWLLIVARCEHSMK